MNEWFEAERRVERAHEMYRSGRWEDALRELRAALRVNPSQAEWHFKMGLTLEELGRFTEAAGCYRKALKHHGEDTEVLNHLGAACIRAGRPLEAIEALERAAKIDPTDEAPYVQRIEAYRQLNDHENAELMFYAACQINDANPRAFVLMSQSLLDRGLADRAIACLGVVRKMGVRDPDVHGHLGEAYCVKGDLQRAHEEYAVQAGLFPKDTMALLDLARVLIDLGRTVEAAAKLRRVVELDPTCAEAHFEMGCVALDADHPDAAQVAFERVLKLDPSHAGVHQRLAAIALRRKRHAEARRHLAAEVALLSAEIPAERRSLEELSTLLMDAGMHADAVSLLTDLARRDPEDAELWHQLAAACFLAGDLEAGVRHGRRAVRGDPRHLPAIQNLVLAHLRRGEVARARYWLRRAERLDGDDPRTRQLRGQLLLRAVGRKIRGFFAWKPRRI